MRLRGVLEHEQAVRLRDLVIGSMSHIWPYRWTATIAAVRGVIGRPRGLRIDQAGGLVDLAQDRRRPGVHGAKRRGDERVRRTITSSPGPMPAARSTSDSADVPEETPTQCVVSQ